MGCEVKVEGLAWLGSNAVLVSSRVVEPADEDGSPAVVSPLPVPHTH